MSDSMHCLKTGGICCLAGIVGGSWTVDHWNPMMSIPNGVCLTRYGGGTPQFHEYAFPGSGRASGER